MSTHETYTEGRITTVGGRQYGSRQSAVSGVSEDIRQSLAIGMVLFELSLRQTVHGIHMPARCGRSDRLGLIVAQDLPVLSKTLTALLGKCRMSLTGVLQGLDLLFDGRSLVTESLEALCQSPGSRYDALAN